MRDRRRGALAFVSAAVLGSFALAGCGDDSDDKAAPGTSLGGAAEATAASRSAAPPEETPATRGASTAGTATAGDGWRQKAFSLLFLQ